MLVDLSIEIGQPPFQSNDIANAVISIFCFLLTFFVPKLDRMFFKKLVISDNRIALRVVVYLIALTDQTPPRVTYQSETSPTNRSVAVFARSMRVFPGS